MAESPFLPSDSPQSDRFISPLSDFGFKHTFGKEGKAKDNLLKLLNAILCDYLGFERIVKIRLNPTENKADNPIRKSTQFDIYCTTDQGHHIIVEMQNRWEPTHEGFEGRPLAYFTLRDEETNQKYGNQFSIVYVHIKEFIDLEEQCATELEKIIYSLRNMRQMQQQNRNPFSKEPGDFYDSLLTMTQYANLSPEEQMEYERWRLHENDRQLRELRAHNKGLAEGRTEGKWEDARNFYKLGVSLEIISTATEIPLEELKARLLNP